MRLEYINTFLKSKKSKFLLPEESCKECTEFSVGVEDPGLGIHTIQVIYPEEGVHARVDK